jgi:hypothetical protein
VVDEPLGDTFIEDISVTISYGGNLTIPVIAGYTVDMWYFDGDLQIPYTAGDPITINGINPGVHQVRVVARDSEGYPHSNDVTIRVE